MGQKGDTLIEVIFAMVIIGVIIATAIQGALSANRSTVAARQRTEATFLAQREMELFRAYRFQYDWDGPPVGTFIANMSPYITIPHSDCSGGGFGSPFHVNYPSSPLPVNIGNSTKIEINYTVSLQVCRKSVDPDAIAVKSTVTWTNPYGGSDSAVIDSTVSESQVN